MPNDERKMTVTWGDNFLYNTCSDNQDPIFDFMSCMGHTFGHNCLKRGMGFCLDYSSKIGA